MKKMQKTKEKLYAFDCNRTMPRIESVDEATEVLRSMRETLPAHYIFKIESFSSLKNSLQQEGRENIELTKFSACGYTWVMSIYPNGNSKDNSSGHLSFYLKLMDELDGASTLIVTSRFFILDQIREKYLTIQGIREQHFHAVKKERGISKIISVQAFSYPSNGFLIDDSCVFGAEVFVLNNKSNVAVLALDKRQKDSLYIWKIKSFSLLEDVTFSPKFNIKGQSWKLSIHPRGCGDGEGKGLSVFLHVNSSELDSGGKVYAAYELCLKSSGEGKDIKKCGKRWFTSSGKAWGLGAPVPLFH